MSARIETDEILDTLEEIFLSEGYHDVTFRGLAGQLGCSNRRLYAIAPSKEALFLAIITRFFSKVKKAGWEKAGANKPLADRIRDYLRVGIEAAQRAGPAFNEDIENLAAGRVLFDEFQQERIAGLRQLINEGIESGEFDGFHSYLVAEVMVQATRRVRDPDFLSKSGMSFAEALTELSRLIRNGLLPR
ncbi:MAG: TetR/AcrR family transcriptional regulator [Pseudomonadota bacterium]